MISGAKPTRTSMRITVILVSLKNQSQHNKFLWGPGHTYLVTVPVSGMVATRQR